MGKTKEFFTTGCDYHLSLSSTSPEIIPSPVIRRRSKHNLPAMTVNKSVHPAFHHNQHQQTTTELATNALIESRKSLYARKKWQSHDDFGSSGSFVVDKNDGCFSRIEQVTPINPFI
jgi:hypothetical protein